MSLTAKGTAPLPGLVWDGAPVPRGLSEPPGSAAGNTGPARTPVDGDQVRRARCGPTPSQEAPVTGFSSSRFCLDSARQTRQRLSINWSNFSLKKATFAAH